MNIYQMLNRERYRHTGGRVGMRIPLPDGVFWSRGWRGCERCGGDVHHAANLQPFREERPGGEVVSGLRCEPR